ncbi:glycosyltransferase [Candidatus Poribacteria bacterium]|nr:glycosyltransferase [Candidatus Poribacteria bacterium]
MKILFLSPTVPFPLTDGGRIRVFNLLKQIAVKSDVTLLALETQPTDAEGVTELQQLGIQVHLVPNAPTLPRVSLRTLVNAFLKRQPITVARYALPAYRQKFRELVATEPFDLVHYEMFHTAQFRTDTDLPSVLSQQNVDSAIWQRLCGETTHPFYKFAYWTQQLAFQRYERVLSPKFDAVTCTSDIDAAVFQRHCAADTIEIIPNGVDVTHYQPDFTSETPAHLIYIGSMDWYPNEDAVAFFADAVLPQIQEKVPDVQFSIVGGNPSARVQRLTEREGVIVTGRVPEIKPYFTEATVFVVPLRIGSGTRLKILEALAMGKAIVSTSVGAEGLDLKDGEEIFIADEPTVFAETVIRLLTDPSLRRRIG